MIIRFGSIIAALITLSACAFGDAELAIGYDAASAKKGLVSEVASSVV